MATKIYKLSATADIIGNYPCLNFSVMARPNQFAQAYATITSDEIDGGRLTKEKALSIVTQVQKRVLSGLATGNIRASSGVGQFQFEGYLTGCEAQATSRGGLEVRGYLVSKDIQLTTFSTQALWKLSDQGKQEAKKTFEKLKSQQKLNGNNLHVLGLMTSNVGGTLTQRCKAIIDTAIKIAKKFGAANSQNIINNNIEKYNDYASKFLLNSASTSHLFGGYYTPSKPWENALINSFIADTLFSDDSDRTGGNFWVALLYLCRRFGLLYAPDIQGEMGQIHPQDFTPGAGDTLPGNSVMRIGANSTILGTSVLPVSQVQLALTKNDALNPNQEIIAYPKQPDSNGGPVIYIQPLSFMMLYNGSPSCTNAVSGVTNSRSSDPSVINNNKQVLKNTKSLIKLGEALCRNHFYFLKYYNSKANISVYFSGIGNVKAGLKATCSGLNGVVESINIVGGSRSGMSCHLQLSGVEM